MQMEREVNGGLMWWETCNRGRRGGGGLELLFAGGWKGRGEGLFIVHVHGSILLGGQGVGLVGRWVCTCVIVEN